ncbi:MAG TPA: hypothetical protein PL124_01730 [Candidatus Cloacimonadota bacterium]|nr:hypothetical protein [Candidatus Cloacimonadota bacterium]HPS38112.1 hypothetical protein [Candidatus Cloacimonadota bacterium]
MKKSLILFTLVVLTGFAWAQAADSLDLPMPQFINPFYDSFSHNYLSAQASGRGNTGIAYPGGVDSALLNPAAYAPDKAAMAIELLIKPPVDASGFPTTAKFMTTVPFGLFGIGGKLSDKLSGAIIYSQPQAITLDDYSIEMNQGAYLIQRYPKYYLNQFTAAMAYHLGSLHFGLSLHNQLHFQDDVPFMRTFERIDDLKYVLRVEPGFLYEGEKGNVGFTVTPPSKVSWDLKYASYDTVLPLKVGIGTCLKHGSSKVFLDLDYEQFSAIHQDYMDRLRVKTGFEYTHKMMNYRLGYIYSPQVFDGVYRVPFNTSATADTSVAWIGVVSTSTVVKNDQHILTGGMTMNHKYGSFNGSVMMSLSNKAPVTQVSLGLSLNLEALKSKDFLRFPDAPKRKNSKH